MKDAVKEFSFEGRSLDDLRDVRAALKWAKDVEGVDDGARRVLLGLFGALEARLSGHDVKVRIEASAIRESKFALWMAEQLKARGVIVEEF